MPPHVYQLKDRHAGNCALCGAAGMHEGYDRDLKGLICDECMPVILITQALLDAWQFTECTAPQKGEPNS